MAGGRRIVVQKVEQETSQPDDILTSLCELCYYYPAYTLRSARSLPFPHVKRLLRTARRLEASRYHNLLQISLAPHAENKSEVSDLLQHYEDLMHG